MVGTVSVGPARSGGKTQSDHTADPLFDAYDVPVIHAG